MTETGRIGRFVLLRRLAHGGMAEVFLARQEGVLGFRKAVVIKRLLPHLASLPKVRSLFLDEAKIASSLNHPNIIQIFDAGADGDDYFLAMEYIHGQNLHEIARRSLARGGLIPLPCALRIVIDACRGLHYAHALSGPHGQPLEIVHRDISPHNLMVSFDGLVKVLDFGIARAKGLASHVEETSTALKGKIAYMSPEQLKGMPLDGRSDVFSMGVLLHEITTGVRLFKGTEYIVSRKILEEAIPLPQSFLPDYPVALSAIVMKALEKDRDHRIASAKGLADALEEYAKEAGKQAEDKDLAALLRGLFDDRLKAQKEAERSGKNLADILFPDPLDEADLTPLDMKDSKPPSPPEEEDVTPCEIQAEPIPKASATLPPGRDKLGGAAGYEEARGENRRAAPLIMSGEVVSGPDRSRENRMPEQGPAVEVTLASPDAAHPARPSLPMAAVLAVTVGLLVIALVGGALLLMEDSGRAPQVYEAWVLADLGLDHVPSVAQARSADASPPAEAPLPAPPIIEPGVMEVAVEPPPAEKAPPAKRKAPPKRKAPKGYGYLSVNSSPWSHVYVDGAKKGDTPLAKIRLTAGSHTVVLKNPDQGLKATRRVRIKANATAKLKVNLKR